jgi:murein DD-endopeptidase MepM/ murein hydrolase activator NlpD
VQNTDGRLLQDWVIGVDHDPVDYGTQTTKCLSYAGEISFPYCYDQHSGTDFLLDGGFDAMDQEVAWVVAAADGTVIETRDGNYDRCHADVNFPGGINCDGFEMRANYVILEHRGGVRTWYWHLKQGTVAVSQGQLVACGEPLGLIGSSGRSAMPHLHFEVHGPDGEVIDPYAGPASQPESWWVEQDGPYDKPGERCQGGL